ncbi:MULTISPECIES: hypothetical protein [unclassified Nostoc]|nr:hypothetical protein [Nostoc sp. S13]MDF5739791.1 hypothetical protein [Nostoc sp. S13]
MGSHCGGRVPRHKGASRSFGSPDLSGLASSGVETPYSPSLRDAPRTGILRQALASPFGRRPRCFTKIKNSIAQCPVLMNKTKNRVNTRFMPI